MVYPERNEKRTKNKLRLTFQVKANIINRDAEKTLRL
jgi:hypothetical protein